MFEFIRTHRRLMLGVLLVVVVPAFAFFGLEGYTGFMSRDKPLAEVNGEGITQAEFDMVRRNRFDEIRLMMGSEFDAEAIDTPAFRARLLNEIIDQRVVVQAALRARFGVSDEQLRDTIASIPAVQENGVFSPQLYRQVLASQGMTPADFEQRVRSDLVLSQVLAPIGSTAWAPQFVTDELIAALTQERTVSIRRFNAQGYEADIEVTDEEVLQWYEANADMLRLPESVNLQYLVLDEAAARQGLSVPEAEIEAFYQQNQARYGQPEQRRVSHILIEVAPNADQAARQNAQERAQELVDRLKADTSQFAALAAEFSDDPGSSNQGGDLGWVSRDTLVPEVESAVFDLEPDTISEVIESPFGFHVAVVTQLRAASIKPLEEVREDVREEILRQMATMRFADTATELTNLVYDERDALAPIAQELGLELRQAEGVSRDGLLPNELFVRQTPVVADQIEILNNPRLLQVAFSGEVLRDRYNSGVVEIGPGTVVVVRVEQVNPPQVPALDQIEDLVRDQLVADGALALARQAGQAALSVIADGSQPPIGFAAAEVVSRLEARSLTANELDAAMRLSKDEVPKVIGVQTPDGYTLLDIKEVLPGQALDPIIQAEFEGQLVQSWGMAEEAAALQVLRQEFDAHVTPLGQALIQGQ
jgi:peptidyl-prolyl cis-trans isomerase D